MMLLTMLLPSQVLLPQQLRADVPASAGSNSYAAILVPGAVSVFGMFLFRQAMQPGARRAAARRPSRRLQRASPVVGDRPADRAADDRRVHAA